jgi:hypothetical protein
MNPTPAKTNPAESIRYAIEAAIGHLPKAEQCDALKFVLRPGHATGQHYRQVMAASLSQPLDSVEAAIFHEAWQMLLILNTQLHPEALPCAPTT